VGLETAGEGEDGARGRDCTPLHQHLEGLGVGPKAAFGTTSSLHQKPCMPQGSSCSSLSSLAKKTCSCKFFLLLLLKIIVYYSNSSNLSIANWFILG